MINKDRENNRIDTGEGPFDLVHVEDGDGQTVRVALIQVGYTSNEVKELIKKERVALVCKSATVKVGPNQIISVLEDIEEEEQPLDRFSELELD